MKDFFKKQRKKNSGAVAELCFFAAQVTLLAPFPCFNTLPGATADDAAVVMDVRNCSSTHSESLNGGCVKTNAFPSQSSLYWDSDMGLLPSENRGGFDDALKILDLPSHKKDVGKDPELNIKNSLTDVKLKDEVTEQHVLGDQVFNKNFALPTQPTRPALPPAHGFPLTPNQYLRNAAPECQEHLIPPVAPPPQADYKPLEPAQVDRLARRYSSNIIRVPRLYPFLFFQAARLDHKIAIRCCAIFFIRRCGLNM